MAKTEDHVQTAVLESARKTRTACTLYLMNGFQMRAVIKNYDSRSILVECDGRQCLVYKHAVSTIEPLKPLPVWEPKKNA